MKTGVSMDNDKANERHERYRSWVVLIFWIIEKIIKKGG